MASKRRTSANDSKTKKRVQPTKRLFPIRTLEESIVIINAIKEKYAGDETLSKLVAQAIGVGSKGMQFFYLAGAARDYDLTVGSRGTKTIALSDLGRKFAYASNQNDERAILLNAFRSVDVFRRALDHFNGNILPEPKYLANILESKFQLSASHHAEFSKIFKANCKYLGLIKGGKIFATIEQHSEGGQASDNQEPSSRSAQRARCKTSPVCFVIMPFSERDDIHPHGFFEEVFQNLIKPAAEQAGFSVKTAERAGSDMIQSTIMNSLLEADLVLADLTEHNANVFFELGVRIHQDKPVVLIKSTETPRVFDVDTVLRVVEYNPNIWPSTIEDDMPKLVEHIKGAWGNRESEQTYLKILLRGSMDQEAA